MQSADAAKTRVRIIESELEKNNNITASCIQKQTKNKTNKEKNKSNCCEVETL